MLIFISSWRWYYLVLFIATLLDENLVLVVAFLLLKLFKNRYLCFWKTSFVCEKSYSFHFYKCVGGFAYNNPLTLFWEDLCLLFFLFFLICFISTYISFLSISYLPFLSQYIPLRFRSSWRSNQETLKTKYSYVFKTN